MSFGPFQEHPVAGLFPLLSEEELEALAKDIQTNGQQVPILIWNGFLIDGRNRWRACERAKVAPWYQKESFANETEVCRYITSVNLKRRHLTESQRAMLGARLQPIYEKEAKKRQAENARRNQPQARNMANLPPIQTSRSREDAAQDVKVSPRSVQSAKTVLTKGAEGLIDAVDLGKVSVSAAQTIAQIPKEEQFEIVAKGAKEILAVAKAIKAAKKEKQREKRFTKLAEISKQSAKELESLGRFPVLYADPPWSYQQHQDSNRSVTNHYPTMSIEEICALKVEHVATEDAVLFLWATSPLLPDAFRAIATWGFQYKTSWVWDKVRIGMGNWGRIQHELVLIATKGKIPTPNPSSLPSSVFRIPREKHSQKPNEIRNAIEIMFPDLPRVELFARGQVPEGWVFWGNQVS